jgi:DNA-binding GntR family transcriptional regulator
MASMAPVASSRSAPPNRDLLSRRVADWLAARIIRGEFRAGERLHEIRVAAEAEVSRSPVREALRLLAAEGLVEIVPRVGARVAPISVQQASDVYRVRLLIEPPCIKEAVETMTAPDTRNLAREYRLVEQSFAAGNGRAAFDGTVEYYRRLIQFSPNMVLREFVESSWTKSLRYWGVLSRVENYMEISMRGNGLLDEAVRARDGLAAEQATAQVLKAALESILAAIEPL